MLRYFSLVISVLFQPLLMPSIVYGMILFVVPQSTSIPPQFKSSLYLMIILSTLVMPMVSIIGFRLSGSVKSLHMKDIKDRLIPFSVTSLFYGLVVYFISLKSEFDPIFWQILALITCVISGLTIVTIFWKMSAHMTGIGGVLALIIILGMKFPTFQELYPLLFCLGIVGVIGSARLYLNAHKPVEIYVGFFYGLVTCLIGFNLIWS